MLYNYFVVVIALFSFNKYFKWTSCFYWIIKSVRLHLKWIAKPYKISLKGSLKAKT
jgi:hypothetical protein